MKRTPMKRSAWPRKPGPSVKKEQYQALGRGIRAVVAIKNEAKPRQVPAQGPSVAALVRPMPKAHPVRNEAYRRAVASLPCVICGVPGYSQAAHGSAGKGMAIKACDLTCFPACASRPGVVGCHAALDQGAMFTKAVRHELEPVWAADTQRRVHALGLWPKKLPYPAELLEFTAHNAINKEAME